MTGFTVTGVASVAKGRASVSALKIINHVDTRMKLFPRKNTTHHNHQEFLPIARPLAIASLHDGVSARGPTHHEYGPARRLTAVINPWRLRVSIST